MGVINSYSVRVRLTSSIWTTTGWSRVDMALFLVPDSQVAEYGSYRCFSDFHAEPGYCEWMPPAVRQSLLSLKCGVSMLRSHSWASTTSLAADRVCPLCGSGTDDVCHLLFEC